LNAFTFSSSEPDEDDDEDDDDDDDEDERHFSILSTFHLRMSRWCFCAVRRRLSAFMVSGLMGSGSDADSLVVQSSGLHELPSPAHTSHAS